jgi:hypothetical protein
MELTTKDFVLHIFVNLHPTKHRMIKGTVHRHTGRHLKDNLRHIKILNFI